MKKKGRKNEGRMKKIEEGWKRINEGVKKEWRKSDEEMEKKICNISASEINIIKTMKKRRMKKRLIGKEELRRRL